MSQLFDTAEIPFRPARRAAIADRMLIDASQGEFGPVSREHFPHHHLAMTSAVFALIECAAESGDGSEFADLWHGILWMSQMRPVRLLPGGHTFEAGIRTRNAPRWHELKILFHAGDYGEPCATVMLADEN